MPSAARVEALLLPLVAWACGVAVAALLQRGEVRRSAEKAARYKRLPRAFKLLCFFAVVPFFTATPLHLCGSGHVLAGLLSGLLLAPASMLLLEIAVVRWYRKSGLL